MSEELDSVLRSLRDVDGVIGSFLLRRQGGVDARDLPQYFDAGALSEIGPRVERLYEAWKTIGSELETASLVFAEHRLHLRELASGYLVVVSSAQVNAPALRMAMGMVGRRVGAALQAQASGPPPPATPEDAAGPSQPAPRGSDPDPSKPRVYRGNIVR